MSILHRASSIRCRSLHVITPINYTCVYNAVTSTRKSYMSNKWNQKRASSYYTFPLFTGTQYVIETFHDYSMMPWWGTIFVGTLIIRTIVTLPVRISQLNMMAEKKLELEKIGKAVRGRIMFNGMRDGKSEAELKKQFETEMEVHASKFHKTYDEKHINLFWKPMMLQVPLLIATSIALRNISGFTGIESEMYPPTAGIETEGLLWLSNLSIPDPLYILPVVLLTTSLLSVQIGTMYIPKPTLWSRVITWYYRGLSVFIFILATQFPSALSLYWTTNSCYGLAMLVALKNPKVLRILGLPEGPPEQHKPFRFLLDDVKKRTTVFVQTQRARIKR